LEKGIINSHMSWRALFVGIQVSDNHKLEEEMEKFSEKYRFVVY
jgi:hypothetical protein